MVSFFFFREEEAEEEEEEEEKEDEPSSSNTHIANFPNNSSFGVVGNTLMIRWSEKEKRNRNLKKKKNKVWKKTDKKTTV